MVVLDRGQPDSERCSSGNSGMIVPSHFTPLAAPGMIGMGMKMMFKSRSPFRIKPRASMALMRWMALFARSATAKHVSDAAPVLKELGMLSRGLYVELAEELGFAFEPRGLISVCRTEKVLAHEKGLGEKARSMGLDAQILDAEGLRQVDPGITYNALGGVFYAKDCFLDPTVLQNALLARLKEMGVHIGWGREIVRLTEAGGRVTRVDTDSGPVEGEVFVIAGGSWSTGLAATAGLRMPLQAGKGYSMTLGSPRELPQVSALLIEGRVALTPMGGKLRVGGTMEIAGLDLSVDRERVEGIIDSFTAYCPNFQRSDFSEVTPWKGLRPCSPDGMPYIGRFDRVPNLIAATGHAMMGVSLGPATGKMVSQLIAGGTPPGWSPMLRPDRFG